MLTLVAAIIVAISISSVYGQSCQARFYGYVYGEPMGGVCLDHSLDGGKYTSTKTECNATHFWVATYETQDCSGTANKVETEECTKNDGCYCEGDSPCDYDVRTRYTVCDSTTEDYAKTYFVPDICYTKGNSNYMVKCSCYGCYRQSFTDNTCATRITPAPSTPRPSKAPVLEPTEAPVVPTPRPTDAPNTECTKFLKCGSASLNAVGAFVMVLLVFVLGQ